MPRTITPNSRQIPGAAHGPAMIDSRPRLGFRDGDRLRPWPGGRYAGGVNDISSVFEEVPGAGRARVLVAGEGREPLVFVHGWPACARVFWPLLSAPALRARFRMLAPDLFGFGRSTLRAPRLTFEHQVAAVLAVARRAGGPCLAVGTSFGARVLLQALTDAPAAFRRVVLLAPYLHRGLIERSLQGRLLARFPRQVRALHQPPLSVVTGVWAAIAGLAAGGASAAWAR